VAATFEVLERELADARARLGDLTRARRELELRLQDARLAEETARRSVEALESVARVTLNPSERPRLAGAQLREQLTRAALRRQPGEPAHWREWLAWLREDGYEPDGRNPEATFVTQLTRSPLVRRAAQDGVYVLDVSQVDAIRVRLEELHEQLGPLPPPEQLALLDDDVRAARQQVQLAIGRAERALREAWNTLSQERPPWLDARVPVEPAHWLQGPPDAAQLELRAGGAPTSDQRVRR
jgi:hypothetical protein